MPISRRKCVSQVDLPEDTGFRWDDRIDNDPVLNGFSASQPCHHEYEVLVMGGVESALDQPKGQEDNLTCPKCGGADFVKLIGVASIVDSRMYPYFDRGLGLTLTSAQHRKQVCAERGVVPIDGDIDLGPSIEEQIEHNRRVERHAAYQDRLKHAPEFKGWREHVSKELSDKKGLT